MNLTISALIVLSSLICGQRILQTEKTTSKPVIIKWVDNLQGDFSFTNTKHQSHSIQCEAWCYEWAGTDFIEVFRKNKDSINCFTRTSIATHCSLQLDMIKDTCYAIIKLSSIAPGGDATYYCTDGFITIDKNLWSNGIMKAEFSFNFEHIENPEQPIYWKGKIFARINMN